MTATIPRKTVTETMVEITRAEADQVRAKYPGVHIRRTAHRYWMEENPRAMYFIGKKAKKR